MSIKFHKAKIKRPIYTHNILDTVRIQKGEREPVWTKLMRTIMHLTVIQQRIK